MSVRIILVDDHQMFRQALRIMLEKAADLEIVAEAGSVAELLPCIRQSNPDVICMDIGMPGINGIAATREVLAIDPRIKVIGLSSFTDKEYVLGLLDAGAVGYVAKAEATDELLRAIRTVQLGRVYLSPGISASLAGLVRDGVVQDVGASRLGPRELQVLRLVSEGHSSQEIAARLRVAPATVDVHRRNIMRKLDLHSVAELTKYAIRNGITSS